MIDLGTLSDHDQSIAWGINSLGWVVGDSSANNNPYNSRAFVWTAADGMVDVNTLLDTDYPGWTLGFARGINDLGQITGDAIYDPDGPGGIDGYPRGFLITPNAPIQQPAIPEPGTMALISLAAAMLFRRRRNV
jgi:probable HAF family extracellular repeat protein